jgi:multidrug efflux pump
MNISAPFIRRPVATALLTIGFVLGGIVGFRLLPVSPLPAVDYPTIQVSASLPGADPETMATSVAAPLERQFGMIAGVTEMTSSCTKGSASIVLLFDLDRNIDGAARDVQAAINAARGYLPTNLPSNPTYRKVNPAEAPILLIALTSDTVGTEKIYDVAQTVLAQKLSQVDGVGQVFVGGSSLPAVRIDLNPLALNNYGITLESVKAVLSKTNVNVPKGQISDSSRTWEIQANDQIRDASRYRSILVTYKNGAAVCMKDIASVQNSVEDLRAMGLVNGKHAIMLVIFRQPNANIIETVDRIRGMLPQLEASLPGDIKTNVVMDRTPPIRASLRDVERTLCISGLLVVLVVFLFLRNLHSTIIPGVAVAVSITATFGAMYLFGFSLNNLSLMALTIATGFVVDDAIVVLENITRHVEQGMTPMKAAFKGSGEIAFTVLSMSISLVAVFIPILLMGGMVGRLFREFAMTLSTAVMMSLLVSLTLTPMMCAFILKQERHTQGRFFIIGEKFFSGLHHGYEVSLRWALRHSRFMFAVTIIMLGVNIYLFVIIPKGFFPEQDTGRLSATIQADQDISFQSMSAKFETIVRIVQDDPDVEYVAGYFGSGGGGATANTVRMFISLKPFENRKSNAWQVIARLRKKLSHIPGAPTFMQPVQDMRIGGRSSAALYQYTLQGENFQELTTWAPRLLGKMRGIPQLADVNSDQQEKGLQTSVVVDRDTAARLGVSARTIDNTLYDAFGQEQVSIMYTLLNQYHVVMEIDPKFLEHPDSLKNIYVNSSNGTPVPLSAFAHFERSRTSLAVTHQSQFPAITLSFNVAPNVSLGDAVKIIEAAKREMKMPSSIRGSFQGTAQAFAASLSSEPYLILAALLVVYLVLGILYESYIHPITILSTLPSAGVGAVIALMLTKTDLSIIAIIGVILLIGIVKKNGIMMVDFALEAERRGGKNPEESIYQACLLRFRPIMMTTMAALLGALPMAAGTGVGSELRRPLGIAIIGGLIFSQMLTLYTTPVMYLYMDRFRLWCKRIRKGHQ